MLGWPFPVLYGLYYPGRNLRCGIGKGKHAAGLFYAIGPTLGRCCGTGGIVAVVGELWSQLRRVFVMGSGIEVKSKCGPRKCW